MTNLQQRKSIYRQKVIDTTPQRQDLAQRLDIDRRCRALLATRPDTPRECRQVVDQVVCYRNLEIRLWQRVYKGGGGKNGISIRDRESRGLLYLAYNHGSCIRIFEPGGVDASAERDKRRLRRENNSQYTHRRRPMGHWGANGRIKAGMGRRV